MITMYLFTDTGSHFDIFLHVCNAFWSFYPLFPSFISLDPESSAIPNWSPFYFNAFFVTWKKYFFKSVCVHTHIYAGDHEDQAMSDPLELVLHMVVSRPVSVLGSEFRSSARAACALSCRAISSSRDELNYDFLP